MSSGEETEQAAEQGLQRTDVDVVVFFADTDQVGAELADVKSGDDVVNVFKALIRAEDSRVLKVDVSFPLALNPGLLNTFARAALWGTGLSSLRTVYVTVIPSEGTVVGLGLPENMLEIAPGWVQGGSETA